MKNTKAKLITLVLGFLFLMMMMTMNFPHTYDGVKHVKLMLYSKTYKWKYRCRWIQIWRFWSYSERKRTSLDGTKDKKYKTNRFGNKEKIKKRPSLHRFSKENRSSNEE
ncbi:hypothetical protein AXX17_AT3G01450 [Arabidopsis thaliana]|uniref:Uncharacterized protein n=1 Tax=Arabidopsis thaliana TaxID=3702 RepID=A0A178VLF1_ARATH|nr:hypothetical protein AXX17_AT3G01450 [Arabidopsis thaliana]